MRTIKRSTNIIKKLYEGLGNYLSPSNFTYMWSLGSIVLIYLIIIILILLKKKIKKFCRALAVRKKKSQNTANNNKYYVDNLVQKEQKKITTVVAKERYGYLFFLNKKKYKYNLKNKIIKRNYYASKELYSGGKSGILTRWFYEKMNPTKRLELKTASIKTNIKKTKGDYFNNKNNIPEKEQNFLYKIKSDENIWKIWLNLTEKQQKIILNYFVNHVSFIFNKDDLILFTNITTSQIIKENFKNEIETPKPLAIIYIENDIIPEEIYDYLMNEDLNLKNSENAKIFKKIIEKLNENNQLDAYKDHLSKIYGNKITEEEILDSFFLLYYFKITKPIRIKSEDLEKLKEQFELETYDYDNYRIGKKKLNEQLPQKDLIIYFKGISENEKVITDFSDDIDIHDITLKINN